jgi:hypothetical protein
VLKEKGESNNSLSFSVEKREFDSSLYFPHETEEKEEN